MIDLQERISESLFGRLMLAEMVDNMVVALRLLPGDVPLSDPYLLAVVRCDLIEEIATQMGIAF